MKQLKLVMTHLETYSRTIPFLFFSFRINVRTMTQKVYNTLIINHDYNIISLFSLTMQINKPSEFGKVWNLKDNSGQMLVREIVLKRDRKVAWDGYTLEPLPHVQGNRMSESCRPCPNGPQNRSIDDRHSGQTGNEPVNCYFIFYKMLKIIM